MNSEPSSHQASTPDSWDVLSPVLPFPTSMTFRPVMVVDKKPSLRGKACAAASATTTTAGRVSSTIQPQTHHNILSQHYQHHEPSLLGSTMQPISLAAFPANDDDWEDEDTPHEILGHHLRIPFRASSPPLTSATTGEPIPEVMEPNEIPTFAIMGTHSSLDMASMKRSPNPMHSFSQEDASTSKFGLSTTNEVSRSLASYTNEIPQHLYEEIDMRRSTTTATLPEHIYPPQPLQ